jgi:hypothetical protein
MKIALWNADCFVGSNFSNYFLQNSKHDIVAFLSSGPLAKQQGYPHMEGALSSRSRFSFQVLGKDTDAALERLKVEKPDVVVCFESFPACLEDRYTTVFIGKNPEITGAKRTFLYTSAFGPRQSPKDQIISSILGKTELPAGSISSLYVKDLFEQFSSFLARDDRFAVAQEVPLCASDIKSALNGEASTKIQNSILHTYAWYHGNPWFHDID